MSAAEYNFTIEQGTTVIRPFVWKDADGVPVDLTGYTARMQVRPSVSSDEVYLDASSVNGKLQLVPLEGKVTLVLSATETGSFTWRRGRYDMELVDADGIVTRLLFGVIEISREVTR